MVKIGLNNNLIKSFFLFLYFTFCILHSFSVSAFLDDDMGLDLYKNIDKWIYELEMKNYEYEMTNWWKITIKQKLDSAIWWTDCFSENITLEDLDKIVNNWDLVTLSKIITDECKSDNWKSISNNSIAHYWKIIWEVYDKTKKQAEEKTDTIMKVSRIWLYSDWDINNSPFDLIKDLEDINTVIFASENKYEGVEKNDNWNPLNNLMNWLWTDWKTSFLPYAPLKPISLTWWTIVPIVTPWDPENNWWEYVCADDKNDSWLDDEVLDGLIWWTWSTNTWTTNTWSNNTWNFSLSWNLLPLESNYKKVNDNSLWKCDTFFCIVIEFSTYNHKLLGWWQNISIESILKKSNDHIHKFTNTSMLQKKMSINDWELSLKNLNLQSIFNLNFIIYWKSPPILNIDKKDKQEDTIDKNSPLAWENQAYEYYKNAWLDYKQANSLQNLKRKIEELKCTQDSWELTNVEAEEKCNQYRRKIQNSSENNLKVTKAINELVKKWDLTSFYDMFVELKIFTKAFENYINWVRTQVIKMDKKPAW